MIDVREYKFNCGGNELAKVLWYYGFINDTANSEQKIVCPFHNDINPSMMVDLRNGNFFCFGCQETGDAFQFVRKMHPKQNELQTGLKYFKILKSQKAKKITLTNRVKAKKENKQAYDEAWDYYYGLSKINWMVKKADDEIVKARQYMLNRGFKPKTLNMCQAKITYNYSYPIIFPLLDNGAFKGWVCRTDKAQVEKKRKYLYNEGFSRSSTLVGTYGNKDYVIIVEGYMDRLKMIQNLAEIGIEEDVVAILGWKASNEHIQKMKQSGVKFIISALDNDECGRKGTEYLKSKFNTIRFCYLNGIKDPGEMNVEQFKKMYTKTINRLVHDRRKQ